MRVKPETARFSADMSKPMLDLVLDALEKSKGHWQAVADGSGVPYHTLTKVAQRRIVNPGVDTVQALANYFGIVVLTKDEAPPVQAALPLAASGT